jgi:hypothetical protein
MALVLGDRVRDVTTTTGTGTVTLSGTAPTGYRSFASGVGNGNTTYYTIVAGAEWEVGLGTFTSSGNTLSRDVVYSSSNSNNLVNFSAGTKDVFVTYPAAKSIADGYGTLPVLNGGTGQTSYTDGQLLIGNSTGNTLAKATLTQGTGITITNGAGAITITNAAPDQTVSLSNGTGISVTGTYPSFTITNSGVTSFSAGTTGLTPSTGTTGAVTLAGTLAVANGGTGANTLSANAVLLGNGTSTLQTVAPGTSGNVLTSNGTTWTSAAASTGAMTLIATSTQAGTNQLFEWTGLSGYDNYLIIMSNVTTSTAAGLLIQLGTGSSPTFITSSYSYTYTAYSSSLGAINFGSASNGVSYAIMGVYNSLVANGASGALPGSGEVYLAGMLGGRPCYLNSQSRYGYGSSGASELVNYGGLQPDTAAKTAIRILSGTSATLYGTFSLYGISS